MSLTQGMERDPLPVLVLGSFSKGTGLCKIHNGPYIPSQQSYIFKKMHTWNWSPAVKTHAALAEDCP